jgi:radical SAM superfamily enzyme YgiQ (UPF0313 family)
MRKPHNLDQVKKALRYKEDNCNTLILEAPVIIGYEGETREDILTTLNFLQWAIDNGLDSAVMLCHVPLPPTGSYKRWREQNPDAPFHELHFSSPSGLWKPREFLLDIMRRFDEFLISRGKTEYRRIL